MLEGLVLELKINKSWDVIIHFVDTIQIRYYWNFEILHIRYIQSEVLCKVKSNIASIP